MELCLPLVLVHLVSEPTHRQVHVICATLAGEIIELMTRWALLV